MTRHTRNLMAGAAVGAIVAAAWISELIAELPKTRTISLHNIHTKETVTVEYMRDGQHNPEALEKINWVLRDWRKNEPAKMDPKLVDLLWEMHAELGSAEPIHIISGYRSRGTNELLRRTIGGQASESRHITGQAADVHFPDVPLKRIRYSALVRERGGVGYYPTSAIPFVHVDTGNVRHWPRLPRFELALLFPNGRSQHQPADGGPISRDDVQVAQARHKDVAMQVAEFHDLRSRPVSTIQVADAGGTVPVRAPQSLPAPQQRVAALAPAAAPVAPVLPPAAKPAVVAEARPQLVAEPRLVDRPSRLSTRPSNDEREKLAQLAALASLPQLVSGPAPAVRARPGAGAELPSLTGSAPARIAAAGQPAARVAAVDPAVIAAPASLSDADPRPGWGNGWIAAPAYDEEHPEELSYRPFPVSAYLTLTASPDDPALARLVHPDVAKTLEMLDQAGSMPPMRLRPGQQVAQLIWAQEFKGEAVALDGLIDAGEPQTVPGRRVRTTQAQ